MKIFLASDHAGFALKEEVKKWLKGLGFAVSDEGAYGYNEEDDYPDFIKIVAARVAANPGEDKGIIIGGSGQGEAIVANRLAGVRAAVYYGGPEEIIRLSREHNNANVLSIGARFVAREEAVKVIKLWLDTPFTGETRHARRIEKIDKVSEEEHQF